MGDWIDDHIGLVMGLAIAAALGVFVLGVVASVNSHDKWEAFRVEHNCRITGRMDGSTDIGFGLSTSGSLVTTTTSTPSRTGWTCDDGVTYWK